MTRALVVDDEPDLREIARMGLEVVAGWTVSLASSGPEALVLAAAEQPDVIVLDVMMPGMDGPETARRLAADQRTTGIPIVLLTAKVRVQEKEELAEGPVAAILAKPFDPMTLARQIEEALDW